MPGPAVTPQASLMALGRPLPPSPGLGQCLSSQPSPHSLHRLLGWALLTFSGNMVATQWGWVTLGGIKPS